MAAAASGTCPLTLERFVNPVMVMCCGQTFSRDALTEWLRTNPTCPLCREHIDPTTLVPNRSLQDVLDEADAAAVALLEHPPWEVTLCTLPRDNITQLRVRCNDKSVIKGQRAIMVMAMDGSGSMGSNDREGNPAYQVRFALQAAIQLAEQNGARLYTVGYDHGYHLDVTPETVQTNGGTSFMAAFEGIAKQLERAARENPDAEEASVVIMSDGQDNYGVPALMERLRIVLRDRWVGRPVVVHTVGFGAGHQFALMDGLRKCGTSEGGYRYAEPNEGGDELYSKMCALIQPIMAGSSVPTQIRMPGGERFVVRLVGDTAHQWVTLDRTVIPDDRILKCDINFGGDAPTHVTALARMTDSIDVWTEWWSKLTDDIVQETIALDATRASQHGKDVQLHATLLKKRGQAILRSLRKPPPDASERIENPQPVIQRLEQALQMIATVLAGSALDARAAADLRDAGRFGGAATISLASLAQPQRATNKRNVLASQTLLALVDVSKPYVKSFESYKYTEQHRLYWGGGAPFAKVFCGKLDDMTLVDKDNKILLDDRKNTLLHVAAAAGKHCLVSALPLTDAVNSVGETALDLAILYGWWKCADELMKRGLTKPALHPQALLLACVRTHRLKTAQWLLDTKISIMTEEICHRCTKRRCAYADRDLPEWCAIRLSMDPDTKVRLALNKAMLPQLREVWDHVPIISFQEHRHLIENGHTDIVEALIRDDKADPNETWEELDHEGEMDERWPLYLAASKGMETMCHVFLDAHVDVNKKSRHKGKTALWIATVKNHSDTVIALLDGGADPNLTDHKGDAPIMAACQRGSIINAQMLLASGAHIDLRGVRAEGAQDRDTAVLVCCRTGEAATLEILIKHILEEIALGKRPEEDRERLFSHFALIDGFCPLLASAEMDKAECIEVLVKYGADLEARSANDNPVLAGGTAVHLASLYGRIKALETLHRLGANFESQCTVDGKYPLHVAVDKGQATAVATLLSLGARTDVRDGCGLTPSFYAQREGNEAIFQEWFFDPLMPVLVELITSRDRPKGPACKILLHHTVSLGCFDNDDVVSMDCGHGLTPLSMAILNDQQELAETFEAMGARLDALDHRGLTPAFWKALRNNDVSHPAVARLAAMRGMDLQNPMLLDVPKIPQLENYTTSIVAAMQLGYNARAGGVLFKDLLSSRRQRVVSLVDKLPGLLGDARRANQLMWEAKLHLVSLAAQDAIQAPLTPAHVLAMFMYTSDVKIAEQVQDQAQWSSSSPWMPLVALLATAHQILPPFTGECYRKVHQPLPTVPWGIGDEVSWPTFVNASKDWTQVSDNGQHKGMVFVIQSKTGRDLSGFTRAAQNKPVLFVPGTRFRVTGYHKFHAVALAQANIRDTTFAITDEEMERAKEGRRNIIVALEEVVDAIE